MPEFDIVIVGAGPAGMTAAIYAKRADMNVLMLDKLAPGGQIINTNEIQNYTGVGTINGAELAFKMFEHTQELGIEMDYATVKDIQEENDLKKIICEEEGKEFYAKAVILATGTRPNTLGVTGEEQYKGKNISWCAICDGPQYKGKDVVIIGGGNSAVEEAIFMAGFVKSLTIVTMFDLTADPIACDKLRAMDNVTIYPYQDVLEFYGDDRLKGVHFKSTKTGEENKVDCAGVFEYVGQIPMTEAFKALGILNDFGYIPVTDRMATDIKGVFAAGDIIVKNLRQVITACSDGAIAAQEAAHYVQNLSDD